MVVRSHGSDVRKVSKARGRPKSLYVRVHGSIKLRAHAAQYNHRVKREVGLQVHELHPVFRPHRPLLLKHKHGQIRWSYHGAGVLVGDPQALARTTGATTAVDAGHANESTQHAGRETRGCRNRSRAHHGGKYTTPTASSTPALAGTPAHCLIRTRRLPGGSCSRSYTRGTAWCRGAAAAPLLSGSAVHPWSHVHQPCAQSIPAPYLG